MGGRGGTTAAGGPAGGPRLPLPGAGRSVLLPIPALLSELEETVSGVDVQRTVVADRRPAEALVELSTNADLLVVGSRGRGGFTELLLGSVSHAAVLHSVCPVVVVPSHRDERGAE